MLAFILVLSFIFSHPGAFATEARPVGSSFYYNFNWLGTVEEAGSESLSRSPYWWVNSGGRMIFDGNLGKTIQGDLPATDLWRLAYAASNPIDTDNGLHPQNIFRLLTRSKWQNFRQQSLFYINKDNLSASTNRNASNGLLFFSRYLDGNNTYYTGIRVDGAAVIKKKINGTYYTMSYKSKVFPGTYNRDTSPNLLPHNKWVGMRVETKTNPDSTVTIKLFLDLENTNKWTQVLTATDDGKSYGGAPILNEGMAGIRTDFMDVSFENYSDVAL